MFCIQCGEKQLDDTAKTCYKCKAPIPSKDAAKNISLPLPQEQVTVPAKKPLNPLLIFGSGCLVLVFFSMILLMMLGFWGSRITNSTSSSTSYTPSPSPTPSPTAIKIQTPEVIDKSSNVSEGVYRLSSDAVKDRLKCPMTAKFPLISEDRVRITKIGENLYRCIGYVDSQNSFGAMVRTQFYVTIEYIETPGWFKKNTYRIFNVVIDD